MASVSEAQKAQIMTLLQQSDSDREAIASSVGVSPGTVSAIKAHMTMGTYRGISTAPTETDELIEASETTFGLERDLQMALRTNIEQLEPGLQIIDGNKERTTEAGRIDITAQDDHQNMVIIELKAGTAAPEALTQLLAYMGAIERQEHQAVRGILIASDFHPRLVYATRAVSNVDLYRYHFKFTFDVMS